MDKHPAFTWITSNRLKHSRRRNYIKKGNSVFIFLLFLIIVNI